MVVVHTSDVTMICPKRDAERVKQVVAATQQQYGDRYL
jgi:mannose-1-phosphate guanylyltransferase